jgi:DNA-binding NarL/FixJ family response regulator
MGSKQYSKSDRSDGARIVVADDHDIVRAGLVAVLSRSRRFQICGEAADEKATLELLRDEQPDLLIMDLFLSRRDGLVLIKDIAKRFPSTRVLVVCDRDENVHTPRVLRAGASGFLMKDAPSAQLIGAIETILSGQTYVSARYQLLIQHRPVARSHSAKGQLDPLSDRELHVYQLIGAGLGTGAIAKELGLSRKTVESYHDNIKWKLGYADAKTLSAAAHEWLRRPGDTSVPTSASNKKHKHVKKIRRRR